MQSQLRHSTKVLPGNRVEIVDPQLPVGERVDVTVDFVSPDEYQTLSILDIIGGLKGHRLFQSAEEVDRYLEEERNSWQR